MSNPIPPNKRNPARMWVTIVAVLFLVLSLVLKTGRLGNKEGMPLAIFTVVGGLVVAGIVVWAAISSMKGSFAKSLKTVQSQLPGALLLPVMVGSDLAATSSRLAGLTGQGLFGLKVNKKVIVALNSSGLHFFSAKQGASALIPAPQVSFVGVDHVTLTPNMIRTIGVVVVRANVLGEYFDLKLYMPRLEGNYFKNLSDEELNAIGAKIDAALRGQPF